MSEHLLDRIRSAKIQKVFWDRIDLKGDSWIWIGTVHQGTPIIYIETIPVPALAVAFVLTGLPIPSVKYVNQFGNIRDLNPTHWRIDKPKRKSEK